MDIITRLKLFLEQNGISNSQFADTCEIPRPTLSQLLNGRNKKVSDEVISKIHAAYPALNIMWLMFGDGDMFVASDPVASALEQSQNLSKTPQSSGGFMGSAVNSPSPRAGGKMQPTINFGDEQKESKNAQGSSLSDTIQNLAMAAGGARSLSSSGSARGRRITSILIFYDDNSFEAITPAAR